VIIKEKREKAAGLIQYLTRQFPPEWQRQGKCNPRL